MSRNLRLGNQGLKSLPEDLCSGFLRLEKIHRYQPGMNPQTLDLEATTGFGKNTFRILIYETMGRIPLGRPRRRLGSIIIDWILKKHVNV